MNNMSKKIIYDKILLIKENFMSIGIIAEYNPFHNGHLYHLNKIKEMYPKSTLILVTNSYFTQRGDLSIINKWDKTKLALEYGFDLVVELPFVFATQGADLFAKGAIEILHELKVDKIVFGSEKNDIQWLKQIATLLLSETTIKEKMKTGISYPKAIGEILKEKKINLNHPNDILGVCYIKEILKLNSKIEPISIQRIGSYHNLDLNEICSASAIRKALKEKKNISPYIPNIEKYLNIHFIDELFPFIKYKILTENKLNRYQTVEEGIEYRLKKYITNSNTLEEFINKVKTKRYSYNRIKRMLVHILCGFEKEEAKNLQTEYIRVLGFSSKGREYLHKIKKEVSIPILTKYKQFKNLDIEIRASSVYSLLENPILIEKEYKNNVIKKICD